MGRRANQCEEEIAFGEFLEEKFGWERAGGLSDNNNDMPVSMTIIKMIQGD